MNRAEHLHQLLQERSPQCAHSLWRALGTAPMRAAHEAKKAGLPVTNLLDDHGQKVMHRHGKSNYAVYTLTPQAQRSSTFQELQEAKKRTEPVSRADGPEEQQPAQLSLLTSHQ